jgi:transposase InsO family protein
MDVAEVRLLALKDLEAGMLVAEVCARYGVGHSQLYVWRARYRAEGLGGLADRSRRPVRSPRQLAAGVEDAICEIRKDHPRYGARKIAVLLARSGISPPANSTITMVLRRRGLLVPGAPRPRRATGRFQRSHPNQLWQIDATQHILASGRACWSAELIDDATRFCLAIGTGPGPTGQLAFATITTAAARYGLPGQLLSDNGLCFTGRLHGLQVHFERRIAAAGVQLIHSRPYHPQTCGKIERFHQTLKHWIADLPAPPATPEALATALDGDFRDYYNTTRPHQALGGDTPASRYHGGDPIDLDQTELPPPGPYPPGRRYKVTRSGTVHYARRYFDLGDRWAGAQVTPVHHGARLRFYYGDMIVEEFLVPGLAPPAPGRRRSP